MPRYVVAVDIHDLPEQLLRTASSMARQAGAELVVLSVYDPPLMPPPAIHPDHVGMLSLAEQSTREAEEVLNDVKTRLEGEGVKAVVALRVGEVVGTVLEVVEEAHADMLIVATHGRRGMGRLFLGSVAEQILRLSTVPVLCVRITDR